MLRKNLILMLWFLFGVGLVAAPMLSYAVTPSSISGWSGSHIGGSYASAVACGEAEIAWAKSQWPSTWVSINTTIGPSVSAAGAAVYGQTGTNADGGSTGYACYMTWTCPSGSNASATEVGVCNAVSGSCETKAGKIAVPSMYYDLGTSQSATLPTKACEDGCEVVISEGYSPSGTPIVNGQKHYFGKATYVWGNTACTAGSPLPPMANSIPTDSCGAGQGKATMNGKTICIDDAGNPVKTDAPKTTTDQKTTQTTQTNSDGSQSTNTSNEKTTTTCDGDNCTTTTTVTNGSGSGSGSGNNQTTTTTTTQSKDDYCAKNPTSAQCKSASTEDDKTSAGDGASTDKLYTKGSRTVKDAFGDFGSKVQAAGFYSAASNFFTVNVGGGSCSGLSGSFAVMGGATFDIDLDRVLCGGSAQSFYTLLGYGVLLCAAWVAFKIALL